MKNKLVFILSVTVILIGLGFFIIKAKEKNKYIPRSFLKGKNPRIESNGFANDGDEKTSGGYVNFGSPRISARDGLSESFSDVKDYRTLSGYVVASTGPVAERSAESFVDIKATSTFMIEDKISCRYMITNKILATLLKGVGNYSIKVKVLDADKKEVLGSTYEFSYFLHKGKRRKIVAFRTDEKIKKVKEEKFFEFIDINSKDFNLIPGEYMLVFRMQLNAQSEASSSVKAIANIDLI